MGEPSTGVMRGIRVVEVAEHTFVPAATAILADWGADVIKIEHVARGDAMRGLASTGVAALSGSVHGLLEHSNRNKRSLGLDLNSDAGLDILHRLVERCDVFVTNKLPGVRARLRIDVDDLRATNPRLIYVSGSGFGAQGADADAGGYDFLAFWCRSGAADAAKPADMPSPVRQPGPAYGDSIGAMTIAGGIAAALFDRERTGTAHTVDVSLLHTGMWALGGAIALSATSKQPWVNPPMASTAMPANPLTGVYRAADGRYLALSMLQAARYWAEFCQRIGLGDLAADERFSTHEQLTANAAIAAELIADHLGRKPLAVWKEALTGMSGQWSVVQDTVEIISDPAVAANGYLQDATTADGIPFQLVAPPVVFDGQASTTHRAPTFNEHGDDILTGDLGFDWDTVIDLKLRGVVP